MKRLLPFLLIFALLLAGCAPAEPEGKPEANPPEAADPAPPRTPRGKARREALFKGSRRYRCLHRRNRTG